MPEINYKILKNFKSLFGGLTDEELKERSRIVTKRSFETGAAIVTEGETGEELYLLEEGVVDIFRTLTIATSKHEFGTKERSFIRLSGENHSQG